MKTIYKTTILLLFVAASLTSCSKKSDTTSANNISALAGNWETTQWGGIINDDLIFTIDKTTAIGTVDAISGNGFGFTPTTVIYSNIKANGDGTYSASGTYSMTGSDGLATRSATMSLQNNNTQLTVYYPALNSSYPAITYIYQTTAYKSFSL